MADDAETDGDGLIRQVQQILGPTTAAAQFAALLYGRNGSHELEGLAPARLARDAREAVEFIAEKPKDRHKVGFRRMAASPADGLPATTVLEVLNDDMPFLVDSVLGEVAARGLAVGLLQHPIFKTRRDRSGRLQSIVGPGDGAWGDGHQESYIAVHLPALSEAAAADLGAAVSAILRQVRMVVADWKPMRQAVKAAVAALGSAPASIPRPLLTELIAFLEWLEHDNFTFLGMRELELSGDAETGNLEPVAGSELGVLRDTSVQVLRRGSELVAMTPEVRRFFFAPSPLIITKANVVSKVHRRAHMDYIGIKTYRADGTPKGEIRVVGLFTSQSYFESPTQVPFLRHKVDAVLGALGYPPSSHDGKAILNILESFPARRAVPDRREAAARVGGGHSRSGNTAARARVRPHRPFRSVRLPAHLRAARPLHLDGARADRGAAIGDLRGPHRRVLSAFHRWPVGAGAIHRRTLCRRHAAG